MERDETAISVMDTKSYGPSLDEGSLVITDQYRKKWKALTKRLVA